MVRFGVKVCDFRVVGVKHGVMGFCGELVLL